MSYTPSFQHFNVFDTNADRTGSAFCTSVHGSFYIPYFDPASTVYFIDESNPTVEQILYHDSVYVLPPPIDPVALARSCDPRKIYGDQVRKITMESMSESGSIVGGPHRLPPKPILFADFKARERDLITDGTQYDGPSSTVSWNYRADMAGPRPIPPTSSVIRFQNSLLAGRDGENVGIDPLETIGGGDIPAWRSKEETRSKKGKKRNNKKGRPKKRKAT